MIACDAPDRWWPRAHMAESVLYLVGTYPSLTETFIENEVEGLRDFGLTIDVQALAPLQPFLILRAISESPLRSLKLWRYIALPRPESILVRTKLWFRALQVLPATNGAKHIHAHFLGYPGTVARALAKVVGVNYSLTAHAHDIYVAQTHPDVIRDASFRITCTEANREFLHERYPDWLFELVRHGIRTENSPRVSRNSARARILAVGRCVEKKGFRYLLEACGQVRQDGWPIECTIVGDGPELGLLRENARELGISQYVSFPGALPHEQVLALYLNADVLVVPSVQTGNGDRDGIPNVLLEAMARSLPVISTNVGGISEVVKDEVTGLVVAPGEPKQLAAAIERIFADPFLRERLVQGAHLAIQSEFSPDVWLPKLRDLICQHSQASESR